MKQKIFNDPVHGFISLPFDLLSLIVDHPYFQRLRRIKQLGLTDYVYPGALHTRFHHALGACHLMKKAIHVLRSKGHEILPEEEEAALAAILLHDVGHGPYSHALENCIIRNVHHEELTLLLMNRMNKELNGKLDLAIRIFTNSYPKRFLHQLLSSQLDVDRMDYLSRDSFFTGVSEGVINFERIIYMLDVVDDTLVVESKGIYSIENFLISRRHMYWQVYLHKTVLCVEEMLIRILLRAKELCKADISISASDALTYFLKKDFTKEDFIRHEEALSVYVLLDDVDVLAAVKSWQFHPDIVLSKLCKALVERRLFSVKLSAVEFKESDSDKILQAICGQYQLSREDASYFLLKGTTRNHAYNPYQGGIRILSKDGRLQDVAEASDNLNLQMLSTEVVKFYICFPKDITL